MHHKWGCRYWLADNRCKKIDSLNLVAFISIAAEHCYAKDKQQDSLEVVTVEDLQMITMPLVNLVIVILGTLIVGIALGSRRTTS